ncbi:MAG: glycosyltransferase [Anaerolineae bacterium]|nr:glycosyltransferase [Anaerolineae bacterium]
MTSPAKIVHIISRLNIGGISPYVIPITALLRGAGYQSALIAGSLGRREGDMSYLADRVGVQPTYIPRLGRDISPLRDLATVVQLYRLLRREKPTIVHTHTAKAGFVGRLAAKLAGVPFIFHTYHGHVFHSYFGTLKTRFYITLERFGAALSTRIIAVSPNLRREIGQVYRIAPLRKVAMVIPGYDLSALREVKRPCGDFRARFGIPAEAPLIGIVGRLVPIKNHALFLSAMAQVAQEVPQARFAIIGDGELRPALEAQAESLGIARSVIFTGWQDDLPAVYGALDCLVLCSKNEGLPSAVIEALVTGAPVVATAVGGVVDMLADGRGTLVPSNDAQALTAATLNILRDLPAAQARAQTLRQDAFDLYHIVPSAQRLIAFYREFLDA